jgi:hypothetical protein
VSKWIWSLKNKGPHNGLKFCADTIRHTWPSKILSSCPNYHPPT